LTIELVSEPRIDVSPDIAAVLRGSGGPALRPIPTTTSASKGSSAYQVHTYPTKVPPGAIEPFILASTEPGATVLDPFCGSGMTGLAALNTGRRAIMSDLAPGAVHLAHNHAHAVDPRQLADALVSLQAALGAVEAALYSSHCPTCDQPSLLRHMVWTDVHTCIKCSNEIRVWDQSDSTGGSSRMLTCGHCGNQQTRTGLAGTRSVPAEKAVACTSCRKLQRGDTDSRDVELLTQIADRKLSHWIPSIPMGPEREMYRRSALHLRGIHDVQDFWSQRSKIALSELWHSISEMQRADVREALKFAFTNTAWHATRMRRYNALGGQRPLTGTLYIPQLVAEGNVFEIFRHQVAQLSRFYSGHPALDNDTAIALARQSSATDLSWLPTGSVDYVFTDPPFGANLFYGDCNIVWESWLGDVTDLADEIVVNRSLPVSAGGKTMSDYESLLAKSFGEMRRVVSPGGRVSVVFHNSDDKVWSALVAASDRAGLIQTDVSVLNKVQRSMKGYKGRSGAELVPFYDLVITYTAGTRAPRNPVLDVAGAALNAVRSHLGSMSDTDESTSHERSLEYLYSLSIGSLIAEGRQPTGLSFKALETLLKEHFASDERGYFAT
jgi:16S rRNA G966 N2-methylase RsmD